MYKSLMLNIYQHTISKPIRFEGIGLHTGKKSKLTILPSKDNTGVMFKRIDLKDNNLIPANYRNVSSAKLCTTLENDHGVKISTVEHILAALYISEIDNAIIEIDSDEVPILDGSAKIFLQELQRAGIKKLGSKRKYLKISSKIDLEDNNRKISIEPNDSSLEVGFKLNYSNKIIGKQENVINFQKDDLVDVAESRTFCLFKDIEKIKKAGLAKGGSLNNAVVIDDDKILNENGLRNTKEFVNHKILDLAGDFLLSGFRVLGKVKCYQGGHELTNKFLIKLFNSKSNFSIFEINEIFITKKTRSNQSTKIAVNA